MYVIIDIYDNIDNFEFFHTSIKYLLCHTLPGIHLCKQMNAVPRYTACLEFKLPVSSARF